MKSRFIAGIPRYDRKHAFTFLRALLLAFGIFGLSGSARAQSRQVYVTASFSDKQGLNIEDLESKEVQIFENGKPVKMELMVQAEMPAIFGLVFDRAMLRESTPYRRSGSALTIAAGASARDLAFNLIDKELSHQTIWVGSYDQEFHLELDGSTDGFRAKEAIAKIGGTRTLEDTFFYTGVFSAVMKMNARHEKRRIIILFMNLIDPQSFGKIKQLKNLLSASNVEFFVVSFASRYSSDPHQIASISSQASLRELAETTAGSAFFAADYGDHHDDMIRRIFNQIRTLYTFGFESTASSENRSQLLIRCTRTGSTVRFHPTVPLMP